MRDADLPRGRELVEQALVLLEDGKAEDRYEALVMRGRIGWWLGDLDDDERWIGKALEVAREIGRKDLEASAADDLASAAIARLDLDRGGRLVAEALELAEESGNITALGWALVSQSRIDSLRGRLDEAAAGLDRAEGSSPSRATPGRSPVSTTTAGSSAAAAISSPPTAALGTRSAS